MLFSCCCQRCDYCCLVPNTDNLQGTWNSHVNTIVDEQSCHHDGLDRSHEGEHNIIIDSSDEDDVYDDGLDYSDIDPLLIDSHRG